MNEIRWARKALKQAAKLHPRDKARVFHAASGLAEMPSVRNVKALNGHQRGYRLRVGNYRVLFHWDGAVKIVSIEEVRKRDERTY